jgi:hypothetical protein
MKFLKYEFTPAQWATAKAKIETTGTDPEGETTWNSELVTAVVELGFLCTEWGTDEDGNQVCLKTSPKYAVDILWTDQPVASFDANVVYPAPCGVHIFAGWEQAYAEEYCKANPEAAYCQPPAPVDPLNAE